MDRTCTLNRIPKNHIRQKVTVRAEHVRTFDYSKGTCTRLAPTGADCHRLHSHTDRTSQIPVLALLPECFRPSSLACFPAHGRSAHRTPIHYSYSKRAWWNQLELELHCSHGSWFILFLFRFLLTFFFFVASVDARPSLGSLGSSSGPILRLVLILV